MAGHLSFPLIFSDVGGGGSGLPPGGTDGQILLSDGAGSGTWADGAVGRTKVVSVPFAFDTPDLLTGAVIYTPTVGELLLDGWIEIVTAWDGTTPLADIGTFLNGSASGLFRRADSAIPADAIDDDTDNPGILVGTNSLAYSLAEKSVYGDIQRSAPAKFTVANPLCVIVTQEGTPGGTSPGAGQGAAIVHLVIWSPTEVGGVTGGLSVTDGSTTVSPVTSLTVTGATVTGSSGNATVGGLLPTSDLSAALAAQGVGALALYGDGSDGDITVDADNFNWPDPTGVTAWAADTLYAPGDIRRSTVAPYIIVRCLIGGTSGSEDPFADGPDSIRRGDRIQDAGTNPTPIWEYVTAILDGHLIGPIWADHFILSAGVTLNDHGWPIYGRTKVTLAGTLKAEGVDFTAAVNSTTWASVLVATLLGIGVPGVLPIIGDSALGLTGGTWGGGLGGYGGAGADGAAVNPGMDFGSDSLAWTLGRRSLFTMFSPFYHGIADGQPATIGSSGGAGRCDAQAPDFDTGPLGGASGGAGSGMAILAREIELTGSISCKGGAGGDGAVEGNTGGGGGGSGGCCVLVYGTKTGAGTVDVSGGAGGSGHGTGTDGTDGSPGDFVEFANA